MKIVFSIATAIWIWSGILCGSTPAAAGFSKVEGNVVLETIYDKVEKTPLYHNGIKVGEYNVRKEINRSHPGAVNLEIEIETFRDIPVSLKFLAPAETCFRLEGSRKGAIQYFDSSLTSTSEIEKLRDRSAKSDKLISVYLSKLMDKSEKKEFEDVRSYRILFDKGGGGSKSKRRIIVKYEGENESGAISLFKRYPLLIGMPEGEMVSKLYEGSDYLKHEAELDNMITLQQIEELEKEGFSVRDYLEQGKIVLVAFIDLKCPSCEKMLALIENEVLDKNRVATQVVMLEKNENIGYFFGIRNIPTFVVFHNSDKGISRTMFEGELDEKDFLSRIYSYGEPK